MKTPSRAVGGNPSMRSGPMCPTQIASTEQQRRQAEAGSGHDLVSSGGARWL